MAFQKYDFVGVSTTPLPYIHDSFPAGQTARYNTMKSMHRGKDAKRKNEIGMKSGFVTKNDMKELVDLKLPKLEINSENYENTNAMSPRLQGGNIYRQKAYFRLKGIPIRKMYTLNRNKAERCHKDDKDVETTRSESKRTNLSLTLLDLKQPESKLSEENPDEDSEYSVYEQSESPWTRHRLRELDDESPIPGFKSRRLRNNRKLGNIVSSRRLQQLLDNEETLDPYSFYMY